ncbi:MAG TPA: cytochrome C oxidase subunit II, partial [Afifellaceae bacterium]|nr:cytochrome C oxidase subunit II [Afifellaceae bacterium]
IRGTPARGRIGPDLTHVGSRETLGAGILPNDADAFARWVAETHRLKPEVKMPAFGMLPEEDLAAIARYLENLQ